MNLRELVFAFALAVSFGLISLAAWAVAEPAGLAVSGVGVGVWAWLVLGE